MEKELKVADIIYLIKNDSCILRVFKAKILTIEQDFIIVEASRLKLKWLLDSGELIFLNLVKGYSDGLFSLIENKELGELLYLKTNFLERSDLLVAELENTKMATEKEESRIDLLGVFNKVDSRIADYMKSRYELVKHLSMMNSNYGENCNE